MKRRVLSFIIAVTVCVGAAIPAAAEAVPVTIPSVSVRGPAASPYGADLVITLTNALDRYVTSNADMAFYTGRSGTVKFSKDVQLTVVGTSQPLPVTAGEEIRLEDYDSGVSLRQTDATYGQSSYTFAVASDLVSLYAADTHQWMLADLSVTPLALATPQPSATVPDTSVPQAGTSVPPADNTNVAAIPGQVPLGTIPDQTVPVQGTDVTVSTEIVPDQTVPVQGTDVTVPTEIVPDQTFPVPSAEGLTPGDYLGDVLYSDIVAYINGNPVPTSITDGKTMVVAEDLNNYGFDVMWDAANWALQIYPNPLKPVTPVEVQPNTMPTGTVKFPYVYTNIKTYLSGAEVQSYAIEGQTLIDFELLSRYGSVSWDGNTRELRLVTQ